MHPQKFVCEIHTSVGTNGAMATNCELKNAKSVKSRRIAVQMCGTVQSELQLCMRRDVCSLLHQTL